MKKVFLCLLILLCRNGLAFADNSVSLSAADGAPGDTVTVTVSMSVTDRVVAAEFSVPIAEGISYVEGSFNALTTGMSSSSAFVEDELRVYFYSSNLENAQIGSGNVFSFKVCLGRSPGVFRILPTVVLSNVNGEPLSVMVTGSEIRINAPQIRVSSEPVDYGRVAIRSSYTNNIEITNTGTTPLNVFSISGSTNELTVSESSFTIPVGTTKQLQINYLPLVTGIREMTLTIESDAVDNTGTIVPVRAETYSVNEFKVGNYSGESDSVITVDLLLDNMEDIAALECAFDLPEGIAFVDSSFVPSGRMSGMKLFSSVVEGTLKLYIYSESGGVISEGTGAVASFKVLLSVSNGTHYIIPRDVILGNKELANVLSGIYNGSIEVMSPILSCNPEFDLGDISVTETTKGLFHVQNTGKKDLIIEKITFEDSLFYVDDVFPIVISPDGRREIKICNSSIVSGNYSSIMRLYTNAPSDRIIDIELKGHGFEPNFITSDVKLNTDGTGGTMTVSLSNFSNIAAVQMTVCGLEEMSVDKSSLILTDRCTGYSSVLTLNDDGSVKVFIYSLDNHFITGNSGELFSFGFSNSKVIDNAFAVTITDIVLSDGNGINISSSDSMAASIDGHLSMPGDANGDRKVDVADIASVVNHIYGEQTDCFDELNADVNGNGVINVSDISGIISIISGANQ